MNIKVLVFSPISRIWISETFYADGWSWRWQWVPGWEDDSHQHHLAWPQRPQHRHWAGKGDQDTSRPDRSRTVMIKQDHRRSNWGNLSFIPWPRILNTHGNHYIENLIIFLNNCHKVRLLQTMTYREHLTKRGRSESLLLL